MHYVSFSQFWSHFHGTMHCLPQRLKSTFFEKISERSDPEGTSSETKIMKITHSDMVIKNSQPHLHQKLLACRKWKCHFLYSKSLHNAHNCCWENQYYAGKNFNIRVILNSALPQNMRKTALLRESHSRKTHYARTYYISHVVKNMAVECILHMREIALFWLRSLKMKIDKYLPFASWYLVVRENGRFICDTKISG